MSGVAARAVLTVVLTLAGCGTPAPGTKASVDPTVAVGLGTDQQAGRSLRRMDIDQLDSTLRALTGVAWTEVVDGDTVDLFERLSGSLGKPDYRSSTQEDLAPGLLFQKFLGDAATSICTRLLEDERLPGGERHLLVQSSLADTPTSGSGHIDADLQRALLLFHGRRVALDSAELQRWRWLFDSAYGDANDTTSAWRTVCVALLTHPAFYAY